MRGSIVIFILGLFLIAGCGDSWIKKPKGLVPEKQMVDILVDLHIANAIYDQRDNRLGAGEMKIKSQEFYYSVLKKYNVADSTFEQSVIYYSNFPKDFERIYAAALDKISQMNEAYTNKEEEELNIGNEQVR
ncbi:MAG: DUF4296 domain-containing protein [Prolixibacteraceae bacterium]|nr:DUF4296 domain-containing protein [Prolixibacteraceae bacterium]MBN2774893.1 DUF4296 domain-containing protein [Prolixibacteraceae bacterium]